VSYLREVIFYFYKAFFSRIAELRDLKNNSIGCRL